MAAQAHLNDSATLAVPALATRYETLISACREIGKHSEPKELFAALAQELREAMPFDFLGVSLRGEKTDVFQTYSIDKTSGSGLVSEDTLTLEETLILWVYDQQRPIVCTKDDKEPQYDRLRAVLNGLSIRSVCALPLTTGRRKLGTIIFGSKLPERYSTNEVEFLSQAANLIALTFDNALSFAVPRPVPEGSWCNTECLQLLLDVTNQLVPQLELRDLLRAVSKQVRRVMQCDFASLSLPDAENKHLRLYTVDFPESKGELREEVTYPIEGSLSGRAFRTMKALSIQSPFGEQFPAAIVKIVARQGLKSMCFLPLTSRKGALGTLNLGRLRDDAFSQTDIEFLTQVANQISLALENALAYKEIREQKDQISNEKIYLEDEIRTELNVAQILGNSTALRRVLKAVETVAPTDSTVLIYGETGTGKELIARAIHNLSGRRSKTFVKLNCAAIPTGLLESELFGHEKGAFTGAIAQRIGRFEVANGGTIFLDEIGEVPLEMQTKLLRILQEREFERLGSSRTLRTDARLIAATNRDLEAMVSEHNFRSDLFYRLNVFPVHVPPLRERQEDIPLLVRHFAQQFSRRMNKVIDTIPSATLDALCRYPWLGNIRELQNVIERAVIISTGPALNVDISDLKFPKTGSQSDKPVSLKSENNALHGVLEETERRHILDALNKCNWVVAGPNGAAALLGMKRSTLQKRMNRLRISRQLR
jgi:formate hydrogenlyase transcriptional activator